MKKIVPITSLAELTSITQQLSIPEKLLQPTGILQDTRQRGLHDLRISVTDRCNFRCPYCMPKEIFTNVTENFTTRLTRKNRIQWKLKT